MSFEGSCHCGAVRFTMDADIPGDAISCNCSHCRRRGFLLSFFPQSLFTLNAGADVLKRYTFNTHKIEHRFCESCGIEAFAYGSGHDGSPTVAVNLRCVPAADLGALKLKEYDGASA